MDPCKDEDPLVIDQNILSKCIQDLFPKGEAGKLTREEGIPMDEVQEIRIEFLRIVRIDHLWPLTALTKLSLSNNLIEKIENLDALIHLVELDLSFNKIQKIENLDALENIETFTLFDNLITKIENMDTLKKLSIFSVGKNKIEDRVDIFYLRRFKELKSFSMNGNPCANEMDFRTFVVTFLPQITYYEYVIIKDQERVLGQEQYRHKISEVEEAEVVLIQKQEKIDRAIAEAASHKDSFVEFLDSSYLFDSLFEEDVEGKAIMLMSEEMEEYYAEYAVQFNEATKQIFNVGQEQYQIRKTEVEQFEKCVASAQKENQDESISLMDDYLEEMEDMMQTLQHMQDMVENNDISVEDYTDRSETIGVQFSDMSSALWKRLMRLEMTLFEQMEEINSTFEHTLTEMVNQFIETAQGLFSQLRALETGYAENTRECANRFMMTLNLGLVEDIVIHPDLAPYLVDKETLNNALGASHDMHLLLIDTREDNLVTRARGWLEKLVTNLQKDEIARSRMKVLDINYFLDLQKNKFETVYTINVGLLMDADMGTAMT